MDIRGRKSAQGMPAKRKPEERNLASLLEGVPCRCRTKIQPVDVEISHITADSRKSGKDALFVALPGRNIDGHAFLAEAVDCGCAAVIIESGKSVDIKGRVCVVEVNDTREAYAAVAANHFHHPAREMRCIGITGTNGKTTVSWLLETIFTRLSCAVGIIGTLNYRYIDAHGNKKTLPAPLTTPEPLALQRLLREMADAGVQYVFMEVSSEALAQKRLGDIRCDIGVFTNLSHDHLDYHHDMEEYFSAKSRLFTRHLKKDASAVLVFAGEKEEEKARWAQKMLRICQECKIARIRTVGGARGNIALLEMDARVDGARFTLAVPPKKVRISSSLIGGYNIENAMTAMAVALESGLDIEDIRSGLEAAGNAPGRLQYIPSFDGTRSRPSVYVDYAHTPDALQKVLTALRELPHRDILCVFGCGGDRDKEKRAVMGEIAAGLCDFIIITDDNPRSESSEAILEDIAQGVRKGGLQLQKAAWKKIRKPGERGFLVHAQREEAIDIGIRMSSHGDIVLIAGKGHENYQIINKEKRFLDDCLEAQEALVSWNLPSLASALGIPDPEGETAFLRKVSTDTRSLKEGDIFLALRGERFDGHYFLKEAMAAGAGALIIEKTHTPDHPVDIPVFRVDDTLRALGDLAGYRRRLLQSVSNPVVVGITGSSGKTTIKEMTAAIFCEQWPDGMQAPSGRVLKTAGNFNNLVGLPLSLLPLSVRHRAVILEMGMNAPHEISRLTEIAAPNIACIANIHAAHLEGLHSIEGVARAKEELFSGSGEESVLIVNLDEERVRKCAEKYRRKKTSYAATSEGLRYNPELWASGISFSSSGCVRFVLHIGEERRDVELRTLGKHNVSNSLAAAAIAHSAGVDIDTISAGLEKFQPTDKRMALLESPRGCRILNDTYNANPASMAAGLATLERLTSGRSIAILGDMLELGESSVAAHRELGRIAVEKGVSHMAVCGRYAAETAKGALAAGMDSSVVRICGEKSEVIPWVKELGGEKRMTKGDCLFVKASRGMRFETIVDQLLDEI